jgi:hypothetical protein
MIIDGHYHVQAGHEPILARMDALEIDRTVLEKIARLPLTEHGRARILGENLLEIIRRRK